MLSLTLVLVAALHPVAFIVAEGDEPTFRHEPLKKLLAELKDKDVTLRRQAAITLGMPDGSEGKGGPRPRGDLWPAMLALVDAQQDKDMQVRANAMKSLGLLMRYRGVGAQTEERFEKVSLAAIAALMDPEDLVKTAAAGSLPMIGVESEKARAALIETMKHPEAKVRSAATDGAKGGRPIGHFVPALAERLGDTDATVRLAAANTLNQARAEAAKAVKPLIGTLRDPDEKVANAAATALGSIGPAAVEAVPALIDLLADPKSPTRMTAVSSLGVIAGDAELAIPALIGAISVDGLRPYAFSALTRFGPQARSAIPAVLAHGRDANGAIDANALYTLSVLDPDSHEYRGLLFAALLSPNSNSRMSAISHFHRESVWPDALPVLAMLFKCDPSMRQRLAQVFGSMGAEAKPVVPMLMEVIGDLQTNPTLRRAMVNAVNRIDPDILKTPANDM
jgi:HEAT repeat protein